MMELQVKGTQSFMGKEIPVVEGGFGEGQKVILAKTIAEIHGMNLGKINQLINNNIDEFEDGIDILDLKLNDTYKVSLQELNFSNRDITISKNIYLLSEQGYMALVMLMRTEKAKEIRKQLRKEYFAMREVINSDEQLKAKLLLDIYNGGQEGILASRELVKLEKQPLLDKIEKDEPKVTFANRVLKSNDNVLVRQVAKMASDEGFVIGERKLYNKLREWGYICKTSTEPTQVGMNRNYFTLKVNVLQTPYGIKTNKVTLVTPKGQIHIVKRLMKEIENKPIPKD